MAKNGVKGWKNVFRLIDITIDIIFFSINWKNYFDRSILVISMTVLVIHIKDKTNGALSCLQFKKSLYRQIKYEENWSFLANEMKFFCEKWEHLSVPVFLWSQIAHVRAAGSQCCHLWLSLVLHLLRGGHPAVCGAHGAALLRGQGGYHPPADHSLLPGQHPHPATTLWPLWCKGILKVC